MADWGRQVRFREHIIDWQPGRSIGWRFDFRGLDAWQFTDRHLMPDSAYFKVTTGGYRMEPAGSGRTRAATMATSCSMHSGAMTTAALIG